LLFASFVVEAARELVLALAVSDMLVRGVGNVDVSMAVMLEQRLGFRFHRKDEHGEGRVISVVVSRQPRTAAGLADRERKDARVERAFGGAGPPLCEELPGELPGIGGQLTRAV